MTPQLTNAPPAVLEAFKRLSPKRQAFVLALPTSASQEAAMLAAGFSAQTARKTAATVAALPDVQTVLNHLVSGAIAATQDSVERLLEELCHLGLTDPISIFDEHDNVLPIRQWPADMRRALSGIEVSELFAGKGDERASIGLLKKVKFWDKIRAIEGIAKIKGYLAPEKVEHAHRIEGMAGLLAEIDGSNTGPGPSRV